MPTTRHIMKSHGVVHIKPTCHLTKALSGKKWRFQILGSFT